MITLDDFEVFCRRSFAGVQRAIDDLGDDLVNTRPAGLDASSAFGLTTHILGVCEWWIGHILLGRPSERDRNGEFTATGTVAELRQAIDAWLASFEADRASISTTTALAGEPTTGIPLEGEWTVGAVLLHVYEEIAQHLGHLEMTVDVLRVEHMAG